MTLLFGGAHMGKEDYAWNVLDVRDLRQCAPDLDFGGDCLSGLERFSLECARRGEDAAALLLARRDEWAGHVLIVQDISCCVVPMDPVERAWREQNGRMLRMLAGEADLVVRLWYGLPQELK